MGILTEIISPAVLTVLREVRYKVVTFCRCTFAVFHEIHHGGDTYWYKNENNFLEAFC